MDRVIGIDWSGDKGPGQKKKICAAIWTQSPKGRTLGGTVTLESGHTRQALTARLIELARETPHMVAGFDFIFSYPAWFLAEHAVTTAPAFWQKVAEVHGEQWLARECADIRFWGKPRKKPPEFCGGGLRRMMRRTDMEVKVTAQIAEPAKAARVAGIAPKSPFQIGGAGSVGTASLRGMPHLLHLRQAGFSVWPFDPPTFPLVVEIYSRLMTGPVHKSSESARTAYLAARRKHFPGLSREVLRQARASEDAFDALITCLIMTQYREEFPQLRQATDPEYLIEGQTWTPGVGLIPIPAQRPK
jgi:hypothetical protein